MLAFFCDCYGREMITKITNYNIIFRIYLQWSQLDGHVKRHDSLQRHLDLLQTGACDGDALRTDLDLHVVRYAHAQIPRAELGAAYIQGLLNLDTIKMWELNLCIKFTFVVLNFKQVSKGWPLNVCYAHAQIARAELGAAYVQGLLNLDNKITRWVSIKLYTKIHAVSIKIYTCISELTIQFTKV